MYHSDAKPANTRSPISYVKAGLCSVTRFLTCNPDLSHGLRKKKKKRQFLSLHAPDFSSTRTNAKSIDRDIKRGCSSEFSKCEFIDSER